jgi:UDP-galactopyranose mutase
MLNTDYTDISSYVNYQQLIFTGPLDEYFEYCYGRLPYRSLQFQWETRDYAQHQPVAVVNYPNEHAYTRVTEFKHLTGQQHPKTTLVYEYPCSDGDPYYPIPRPENADLYKRYKALAESISKVHFVGRLGTYRYYNMDQVTAQALTLFSKLTGIKRGVEYSANEPDEFSVWVPCPLMATQES